ncbi:hypothetical protein N7532_005577 [Penicillium argentinense]|uniref:Cullin family profile domain-containing protein n=1 Tax=Penicillium argentinense TaxID=1131581 RepID=A0A9W9FEC4_9EURO|nr:uncharacterized protein N7532_005577 [Penicillium argentinense]KAJ5098576.1 hypothetical protein N7532_005577 [Penicillium argentinense]
MQWNSSDIDQRSGKRTSTGKRKPPDQGEPTQPQSQRTISELLSNNSHDHSQSRPPSSKRSRFSVSPARSTSSHPVSPNKMYNFAGSPPKNSAAFLRANASSNGAPSVKPHAIPPNNRQTTFSPHGGAKKLVVKNLRTGPRASHEPYFEKTWTQLNAALTAIFEGRKPEVSLEELYKGAENICRHERAALLAKKVVDRCKEYVSGTLRENLVKGAGGGTDVDTLRAVIEAWSTWHSRLITVRWIFYYLDQSFLLHSKDFPVIQEMGHILFYTHIFADPSLKPRITQGACNLIAADRGAETAVVADSTLLRDGINLFHSLDVYNSEFEPLFIAKTQKFVSSWAERESRSYLASYVDNSHHLIEREVERCNLFSLNRSTKQKLSDLLDEILVLEHEDVLLDRTEILGLLRSKNSRALKQLYDLLYRRDLSAKLSAAFGVFIVEEGSSIVFDEGKEAEMVSRLLEFKRQLDETWANSFDQNSELLDTLRQCFGKFMNLGKKSDATGGTDNPKTGEMIAKHVDRLLKGGWKMPSSQQGATMADEDAEVDRQLDQALDLFRFVQGKAVFEAFYKNDLARRLLMGRSASNEAEKSMLIRLKKECGPNFTHNLESMFKDMEVARDEMNAYKNLQRERSRKDRAPVDLDVNVLSAASWPSYPDVPVRIPPSVAASIGDFETFYYSKHTGRKLNWKHQLAHCQLRAHFPKGAKELVVSSFQATVLVLFNDLSDGETLGYAAIQEATGLSDPELQRTLQSLACAKYRVLSKSPKGKDVNKTDTFSYNAEFTDVKMRIKINQIQLKETKEENKSTHERVAADRQFESQAAIVRIMKSRKTIKHQELIVEVTEATRSRGMLQPAEIKANIEKLIEKDYMERGDNNTYNYVA